MRESYNLTDFVIWRGNEPIADGEFHLFDGCVLAELSYLRCGKILTDPSVEMQTGDLINKLSELSISSMGSESEAKRLMNAVSESIRFGKLPVSGYVDIIDGNLDIQFSAMTFLLTDGSKYISFRGTDDSIVGWKEDFMISFTVTESQKMALRYVKECLNSFDGEIYIGGHSKGANLALYSSAFLSDEEKKRVRIGIILCSFVLVLFIKDGALFILSTITMGIIAMVMGYLEYEKIGPRRKARDPRYVYSAVICVFYFLIGAGILISPDSTLKEFGKSLGMLFIIDSILSYLSSAIEKVMLKRNMTVSEIHIVARYMGDISFRNKVNLIGTAVFNSIYAIIYLYPGFKVKSLWFLSIGGAELVMCVTKVLLLITIFKSGKAVDKVRNITFGRKMTGITLLIMSIMTGSISVQNYLHGNSWTYSKGFIGLLILFTGGRLVLAVIALSQEEKRRIFPYREIAYERFAGVLLSLFAIVTAVMNTLQNADPAYAGKINIVCGSIIYFMIIVLGIIMIFTRDKNEQEYINY